jgi:hypothetical protein
MRRLGALVLLVLMSCGQGAGGIGQSAAAALEPQVQQVRAAATNGDRAGAAAKLAELRQTVADLRQREELSEEHAAKVLAAAAAVEAQLGSGSTPAPQVTSTTLGQRDTLGTTRTTKNDGKGNSNGNGNGNGKDD